MPFRAAVVIAALVLPGAALADTGCLTSDSIKEGVTVTVKGGGVQTYRAQGKDVLAEVPVLAGGSGFVAELVLAGGLHVVSDHRTEHEAAPDLSEGEVLVGGNDGGTTTTTYRFAALPRPGKDWTGKVKVTRDQDGPSIGPQPTIKGSLAAEVTFLPEETVQISGCSYRIQPVETRFTLAGDSRFTMEGEPVVAMEDSSGQVLLSRRQIWFPDLGFAVITRERGAESGWSEDWGQGIIGLASQ